MLSAQHRLRRPADFSAVIRHGARSGRGALVVHLSLDPTEPAGDASSVDAPVRVGFVVPRTVGSAVVRNQVTRRLRALSAERIVRAGRLPAGSRVVIRALPAASVTPYAELGEQLDAALTRATDRAVDRAVDRASAGVAG